MTVIPPGFVATRRTPDFTEGTVPEKLRGPHSTAAGVWALIHVVAGRLLYRVLDPDALSEILLEAGAAPGVIVPQQLHCVEPQGPVVFHVEFYRTAEIPASPIARSTPLCTGPNASSASFN